MKMINFVGDKIGNGGVESFLTNASAYIAKNIDYEIVSNYPSNSIYIEKLKENGCKVLYLGDRYKGYIRKLYKFFFFIRANRNEILWIHASSPGEYIYAFLAKLAGMKKLVYHVHNVKVSTNNPIRDLKNAIFRKVFRRVPTKRIACSKQAGVDLYGTEDFIIIHNGIDIDRFKYNSDIRKEIKRNIKVDENYVIGQVGRFSKQKNQLFTLNLLHQLISIDSRIILVMVGSGEDKEKLIDYINNNELQKNVVIVEPTNRIEDYYNLFDIAVFPSCYEGLPLTVLEAQCSGCIVLCSTEITNEIDYSDELYHIALNEKEKWIETVFNFRNSDETDRNTISISACERIRKNGYSNENSANEIFRIYEEFLQL